MSTDRPFGGVLVSALTGARRWIDRFGCMSGMLRSEICELRRSSCQIDSQGRAFVVTERPTKNREFLKWPLEVEALAIIEEQLEAIPDKAEAFLFPGPWGGSSKAAVARKFPEIVRKASLTFGRDDPDGIIWHTTRHTMASLALNNGIPEPVVMALGNWKSRALVSRYSHLGEEVRREAAGELASIVGSRQSAVKGRSTVRKKVDSARHSETA